MTLTNFSPNGTTVNGKVLEINKPFPIPDKADIEIDQRRFRFEFPPNVRMSPETVPLYH